MRVVEAVAGELAGAGVDALFGVVGEGNVALATLAHQQPAVRYVAARREDGAVAMADGYARASGRLGVCTVTHGPGLTNTVTALTEAVRARTSLVLLAGGVGLADRTNRQRLDQRRLAEAAGAPVVDVLSPALAVADLRAAMTRAMTDRTPVVVNLPVDVLTACFVGDGGLMMSLAELDTARRYGLPLLVVVMNDHAYGAEVHLCRRHGLPDDLAWFTPVDFAATAAGLGVPARSVTTLDGLAPAVAALTAAGGPALLDLQLNARVVTRYYRDAVAAAAGDHRG